METADRKISYEIINGTLMIRIPSMLIDYLKAIEIYSDEGLEIALDHTIDGLVLKPFIYKN